jgi:hypothetical protein
MKGDFSRVSFDAANHFSRVLTQQGRVTLDADFNEQADILLHTLRTLARDLFGAYGGPVNGGGFGLIVGPANATNNLTLYVGSGHYYVDGILCESDGCDYAHQPDYAPPLPNAGGSGGDALLAWLKNSSRDQAFWIYLDVWERHITWIEQDSIREVALGAGGPDTCTRSKVVWQVKALPWDTTNWGDPGSTTVNTTDGTTVCTRPLTTLKPLSTAQMAAQLSADPQITDPCVIAPDAKYRGAENQLYRVEVHRGGTVGGTDAPTFKWSRDNGSVATRWLGTEGNDLIVAKARGFAAGGWVELSDDALDLSGEPGLLVKLAKVQGDRLSVDPASILASGSIAWAAQRSNPKVRSWDQSENDNTVLANDGAISIVESTNPQDPNWIDLEDGIQVWFKLGGTYRSGDYWLIPARVASGSIEWKPDANGSLLKAPQGVKHHYAPLGIINWPAGSNLQKNIHSCRFCNQMSRVACLPSLIPLIAPVLPGPAALAKKASTAAPPTKSKRAGKTGRR